VEIKDMFRKFAIACATWVGSSYAFVTGLLMIAIWAATGPLFRFSDTWQLVINTSTTIVTFLMVFIIQYTQNRDTKAINLKLDELLRALSSARNGMIQLEENSDETLNAIKKDFQTIVDKYGESGRT
jgi:low affinity Fe/Cu permease